MTFAALNCSITYGCLPCADIYLSIEVTEEREVFPMVSLLITPQPPIIIVRFSVNVLVTPAMVGIYENHLLYTTHDFTISCLLFQP